jgi:hypothetical protein
MHTADGTTHPVKGVRTVKCTPNIQLATILHVLAFPVNSISLSSLVDQIDCSITFNGQGCLIRERKTDKNIGEGIISRGLWYLDRENTKGQESSASLILVAVKVIRK